MINGKALVGRLREALIDEPGLTARELASRFGLNKSDINSALYSNSDFKKDSSPRPRWFVQTETEAPLVDVGPVGVDRGPIPLHPWQKKSLAQWNKSGRRGVVEAVTGAGKTRVGLAAIEEELKAGGRCAVIVPTMELRDQWLLQLEEWFPDATIGSLAGDSQDTLADHDIIVAIVNSASRWMLGLRLGTRGLLVADECHRYGAENFSKALEEEFGSRLGLSATHARTDGRHLTVLEPYFGPVVFTLGYREAIEAGVIANFVVATMGVDLSTGERAEFEECSERMSKAWSTLINTYGVTAEPFADFMAEVNELAEAGSMRESMTARRYLKAVTDRRAILASASAKLDTLGFLSRAISDSNGTLVFTEKIETAEAIAESLRASGIEASAIHAQLKKSERRQIFEEFSSGHLKVIVAPKVLDEGVDVPEADLAVIFSASRTRRQMIQRMGRVLRLKEDGRLARFVLVYVKDSPEDPRLGAHEAFFDEVLENASVVVDVKTPFTKNALARDLAPFRGDD
jgi:superfamily II DNA or RNA helicase